MSAQLEDALSEAGGRVAFQAADAAMEPEEVRRWVEFVLDGGGLLLGGGEGGLPAALGLRAIEANYTGRIAPTAGFEDSFEPRTVESGWVVTGAGYALLRTSGEECVLLGAPRGRGWVAFFGCVDPPPPFLIEAIRWLADRAGVAKEGQDAY